MVTPSLTDENASVNSHENLKREIRNMVEPSASHAHVSVSDLRLMAIDGLTQAVKELSLSSRDGRFVPRAPPPLLRLRTEEEEAAALREATNRLVEEERPDLRSKLAEVNPLVQRILDAADAGAAIRLFQEAREVASRLTGRVVVASTETRFTAIPVSAGLRIEGVSAHLDGDIHRGLIADVEAQAFVASVMQMCRDGRANQTSFSSSDELALLAAYRYLDSGVRMPRNYEWIRTDDSRPRQTYLSFADPGDGHLAVTCRDASLLDGIIAHVEYIDRDSVDRKDLVEAYRLPALRNASRVRLHVGDAAPCTAFIGRPVFEGGSFELGLLKAAHTMAGVCSSMFAHGIADCKVAMDGMTAAQAVEFMRVVAGNVLRDPLKQRLSAAINVNTPLVDDLPPRTVKRTVTDRLEIARLAVQMVVKGQFDKVAWDGASDERPSRPLLVGQIKRADLLSLVHLAHMRGLETYISAGMKAEHMRDAVLAGVGGVGIGMSLHEVSPDGTVGPIDTQKVRAALDIAKKAQAELLGQAAATLAKLDWRYAEGALNERLDSLRRPLFEALATALRLLDARDSGDHKAAPQDSEQRGQAEIERILAELRERGEDPNDEDVSHVRRMRDLAERRGSSADVSRTKSSTSLTLQDPAVAWASRVLDSYREGPPAAGVVPRSEAELRRLASLLERGDVEGLRRLHAAHVHAVRA
jgi:hypothetical protein